MSASAIAMLARYRRLPIFSADYLKRLAAMLADMPTMHARKGIGRRKARKSKSSTKPSAKSASA